MAATVNGLPESFETGDARSLSRRGAAPYNSIAWAAATRISNAC